jgi:hypothetical protein
VPKEKLDIPPFDPHALIAKSRNGALRHGEVHSLSVHVRGLERALEHKTEHNIARVKQCAVEVCLNDDMSALLVVFPGNKEHAVSLPLERPDLAIDFLVKALRERRGATPNYVGTPGAPTQHELTLLARASRKQPRKVGHLAQVTLEDLDL